MESLPFLEVAAATEAAIPGYWMRWQTLVCGLIIVVPTAAAVAVLARWKAEPLKTVDLWAPCWAWMHPAWLLAYRGLVFLSMVWLLSRMVLFRGLAAFYFYTQWTFTLVIVYFAIATIISAHGCWLYSKRCISEDDDVNRLLEGNVEQNSPVTLPFRTNKGSNAIRLQNYEEEAYCKRAGIWGYAMQIIYQTSAGAVMLTDIVFWFLLEPLLSSEQFGVKATSKYAFLVIIDSCWLEYGLNIFCFLIEAITAGMHSLNAVFLLIDTFLNSMPFPWFRMTYFVFWSCIYVTFQWTLHACGFIWWPYPFLELDTPWSPLWYLGIALIHVPCYVSYWLIVKAKSYFCPKFFPSAFARTF